jgi:hypothetical protein
MVRTKLTTTVKRQLLACWQRMAAQMHRDGFANTRKLVYALGPDDDVVSHFARSRVQILYCNQQKWAI